jgi:hypothetical protein
VAGARLAHSTPKRRRGANFAVAGGAPVQEGQSTVEDYDRLADFDASSVDGITKSLGRAVDEMDDVCPLRFLRVRLKKMNSKRERLTSGYPFEYKSA